MVAGHWPAIELIGVTLARDAKLMVTVPHGVTDASRGLSRLCFTWHRSSHNERYAWYVCGAMHQVYLMESFIENPETSLKDGVDSLESLSADIDEIVTEDVVDWLSCERLIPLMIVMEQYRRSHLEFLNDHFPISRLDEGDTETGGGLSPSQLDDLRKIQHGDATMRSFFVEAVLTIASWVFSFSLSLTWSN
jgi:hypothetical protein